MENRLSLTNGVNKNGLKSHRTNGNFFHLGTNYRRFCYTMGVHKLKVPQEGEDQSVVEQGRTVRFIPYRMLPSQREVWSQSILVKLLPIDFG